jgi:YD repeat-containing protein
MNNDLKVEADDFTLDALQKGVFAGSPEYNEKFDINGDGVIDITDLDYIKDYMFGNIKLNALIPGKFLSNYTNYSYDVTAAKVWRTTRYEYDKAGNLIKEIDCNNNTTTYEYDALNRLISVTDKLGGKSRVFYDEVGNVVKEVSPENYNQASDNGQGTTYTYDSMNRLVSTTDASGSVVQKNVNDVEGNIIKTIDAKGYLSGSGDSNRYGTEFAIFGRFGEIPKPTVTWQQGVWMKEDMNGKPCSEKRGFLI